MLSRTSLVPSAVRSALEYELAITDTGSKRLDVISALSIGSNGVASLFTKSFAIRTVEVGTVITPAANAPIVPPTANF